MVKSTKTRRKASVHIPYYPPKPQAKKKRKICTAVRTLYYVFFFYKRVSGNKLKATANRSGTPCKEWINTPAEQKDQSEIYTYIYIYMSEKMIKTHELEKWCQRKEEKEKKKKKKEIY